jgi:hypothetical protein
MEGVGDPDAVTQEWWFDGVDHSDGDETSEGGGGAEATSWTALQEAPGAAADAAPTMDIGQPEAAMAAAPARSAPPIRHTPEDASPSPRTKRHRRNYGRSALSADQVEAMLLQDLPARPLILHTAATAQVATGGWIFKEIGKRSRPADPRADKWRRGGGAGDATDLPNAQEPRVRRRYGYLVPQEGQSPRLRYHQYCRLAPIKTDTDGGQSATWSGGSTVGFVEDTQTWLFHVLPEAGQVASPPAAAAAAAAPASLALPRAAATRAPPAKRAPRVAAASAPADPGPRTTQVLGALRVEAQADHANDTALLHLKSLARSAGETTDFVKFEEAGGRELGGIYHSDHGLQLRSAAGDFAEWHPALDPSQLPYAEGSVVGLFGGKISLSTANADMVAVVSRRAMCVGSFPGKVKAAEGDIVAYLGQVPVRVRGPVASGETLVPSPTADGTAVARQKHTSTGKDTHAAVIGIAMSVHTPESGGEGMVDTLITPPSAQQQQQQQQHQPVDPANDFSKYQHRSARKNRWVAWRKCLASLAIGVVLPAVLILIRVVSSTSGPVQHQDKVSPIVPSSGGTKPAPPATGAVTHHPNNCSIWESGCGPHGDCVASNCECLAGWSGASCEDVPCGPAVGSPGSGCPFSNSACLPQQGDRDDAREQGGTCWPRVFRAGMVNASDRSMKPIVAPRGMGDVLNQDHEEFLGDYQLLDGLSCSSMPVYKHDAAWTCPHNDAADRGNCIEGDRIPSFLFMRRNDISHSRQWVIGLGDAGSGYKLPDCESTNLVFSNSVWTEDSYVAPMFLKPYNPNADGGPVPGNRFAIDITPCQSSPSVRGCDLGWLECMGDFVTRRKDGLTGCGPITHRSEIATEEDYWHSEVEWHNANTLIVRPQ